LSLACFISISLSLLFCLFTALSLVSLAIFSVGFLHGIGAYLLFSFISFASISASSLRFSCKKSIERRESRPWLVLCFGLNQGSTETKSKISKIQNYHFEYVTARDKWKQNPGKNK